MAADNPWYYAQWFKFYVIFYCCRECEVFCKNHSAPFSKVITFHKKEPFDLEAFYTHPHEVPYPDSRIGKYVWIRKATSIGKEEVFSDDLYIHASYVMVKPQFCRTTENSLLVFDAVLKLYQHQMIAVTRKFTFFVLHCFWMLQKCHCREFSAVLSGSCNFSKMYSRTHQHRFFEVIALKELLLLFICSDMNLCHFLLFCVLRT